MTRVYVKDEKTGNRPYFIYLQGERHTTSTSIRFNNKRLAELAATLIQKMLDEESDD